MSIENKIEYLKLGSYAYLYTFNNGNFRVNKVKLLEDRYVEFERGFSHPIEDSGDYILLEDLIDVYKAFENWCDLQK